MEPSLLFPGPVPAPAPARDPVPDRGGVPSARGGAHPYFAGTAEGTLPKPRVPRMGHGSQTRQPTEVRTVFIRD